jgi:hypothetical protein
MSDFTNPPTIVRADEDLVALAGEINAAHEAREKARRKGLEHYRRAGEKLLQAKEQVGHGNWLKWVKESLKFSDRKARRYMEWAKTDAASDLEVQEAEWRRVSGHPEAERAEAKDRSEATAGSDQGILDESAIREVALALGGAGWTDSSAMWWIGDFLHRGDQDFAPFDGDGRGSKPKVNCQTSPDGKELVITFTHKPAGMRLCATGCQFFGDIAWVEWLFLWGILSPLAEQVIRNMPSGEDQRDTRHGREELKDRERSVLAFWEVRDYFDAIRLRLRELARADAAPGGAGTP